ncbi:MAG: GGDEF domain-containing protein [Desulfobacula sp.]|nr:GGDEF domain-containing protein [Desulfobacula sp.]
MTVITAICLFRWIHLFVAKWKKGQFEKLNNQVFILSVVLTGFFWGIGFSKFMIQSGEPEAKLLMVICSIGLCAGGVVAFIPALRLSLVFSYLMIGPATLAMCYYLQNWPLIITFVLFLVYMSLMAIRGNKEYWDALENEHLLKQRSKDLEKLSQTDSLTGLYNRRYFDEICSVEWNLAMRNQTSISVIICDIDLFKQINDQYGHQAGDEYLKEMTSLLKQNFKRKTDIVARYGGEEFIILILNEKNEITIRLAEKLRSAVQNFCLTHNGQSIQTTLSLGLTTDIPGKGDKMDVLISKADKALYESKSNGRNKVTVLE